MQFVTNLNRGCLVLAFGLASGEAASAQSKTAHGKAGSAHGEISYEQHVTPLLSKYCYGCHGNGKKKGDLALDAYKVAADAVNDPKTWEKILQNVRTHVMPPEKKPQPS